MGIAYYIAVHHKAEQFRWLWRAIYSKADTYCIHIDAKSSEALCSEVRAIVGDSRNVRWLPRRSIVWAGWSMVGAELDAMRLMLANDGRWQRWINLSGQDYPIKPLHQIREQVAASTGNHIRCWPFTKITAEEPDDHHLKRRLYIEYRGKMRRTPFRMPFPGKLDLQWKGAQWHMLNRSFCEWVIDSPIAKRVANTLRFTFCPDETFFQAAIMNSPFSQTVNQESGRFVLWPGPKTLRTDDLARIKSSDCLFARKFDRAVDAAVLHELATLCGHATP